MDSFILAMIWRILMVFGCLVVVAAECPSGCSECSGSEKCTICLERYRLEGVSCVPCPDRCLSCSADNTCQRCESPYYGVFYPQCNRICPVDCDSSGCDALNGLCFRCQEKYYGVRCSRSCDLCKNGECDRYSCIAGCTLGYYERKLTDTESDCLRCSDNCKNCTDSNNCFQCIDGYYTVNNYFCTPCSSYIHFCAMCSYNVSVTCKACQEGYYLENNACLEYSCPAMCQGNCNSKGTCIEGCMEGYSGIRCEYRCASRCQSCAKDNPNVCTSCTGDVYTPSCTMPCGSNCIVINGQRTCSFTGHCYNGCLDGYWRPACNQTCPVNCKKCEQTSDICTQCKQAFYGQFCEKQCSSNCLDADQSVAICTGSSGDCLQGCKLGFTGSLCNVSASSAITDVSTASLNKHEDSPDKFNTAVIGGATAGGVVVFGMLIGIGVICLKRRSRLPHSPNSTYVNTAMAGIDNQRNRNMGNGWSGMGAEQSTNPSLYEPLSHRGTGSNYSVLTAQNAEVVDTPLGRKSPTIYYNLT